ncbi:chromatin-remodeling complex subunit ies6 [Marasmius tenuissimus]|nr:chromatin-remodeling complex subunit ies6 [Marasmius tenuissimus]
MYRPPKGGKKKVAATDGASTPQIPSLAEQLSYLHEPRPFKNPNYTKNVNRRAKNLKNVLTQERERERAERERRLQEKAENGGMEVDGEDTEIPTYTSIEAPPSFLPQKHWCDITGLEAPYTDPTTGLRYHDKDVFTLIKGMSASIAKDYLSARGVQSIVK